MKISDSCTRSQTLNVQNNNSFLWKWSPNYIRVSVRDIPPNGSMMVVVFAENSTALQMIFKRVAEFYTAMLHRKAFWHLYTGEGMVEMEWQTFDCQEHPGAAVPRQGRY